VGSIVGKQLILLRKEDSCEGLIESNRIFRVKEPLPDAAQQEGIIECPP
jgi:hypothetical protein